MSSGLGKVILVGEHAVVYGMPAVAGALAKRVRARVVGPAEALSLRCPQWQLEARQGDGTAPARALAAIARAADFESPVSIELSAEVPARAGLGSSAALCVALTRALIEARGADVSASEIERIAGLGEREFHDNPSGVDVALATRGGLGVFRRGVGLTPLPAHPLELAIGLTGEPRQTAARVRGVAERRAAAPAETDRLLGALGALAERTIESLRSTTCDAEELGAIFREAQATLVKLDLSSPGIDRLVGLADESGASGAKLTGAGGGGAVIAIAPPERLGDVARAWRQGGFDAFVTTVGARP